MNVIVVIVGGGVGEGTSEVTELVPVITAREDTAEAENHDE